MPRITFRLCNTVFWVLLIGISPIAFSQTIAGPGAVPVNASSAESTEPGDSAFPVEPFPLIPILETIRAGEIHWRPDWPVSMPPDAFTVSGPPPAEIALLLESGAGSGGSSTEYLLRRNGEGLLTDFPVYLWDTFFQAALSFDTSMHTRGFTIATPVSWTIEFREYDDESHPAIARIGAGDTRFFAAFQYSGTGASETWYGEDGTALAVFTFTYTQWDGKPLLRRASLAALASGDTRIEAYHYDSLGNVSAISKTDREFTARYRRYRPQYWDRPYPASEDSASRVAAGTLALQWDERGFLTRLSGGRLPADCGEEAELDLRYEYTQDERNNWTLRREITMRGYGDYLIPRGGETIRRRITY